MELLLDACRRDRRGAADGHPLPAACGPARPAAGACTTGGSHEARGARGAGSHWRRHPVELRRCCSACAGDGALVGGAGDQRRGARELRPRRRARWRRAARRGRARDGGSGCRSRTSSRCAAPAGWSRRWSRASCGVGAASLRLVGVDPLTAAAPAATAGARRRRRAGCAPSRAAAPGARRARDRGAAARAPRTCRRSRPNATCRPTRSSPTSASPSGCSGVEGRVSRLLCLPAAGRPAAARRASPPARACRPPRRGERSRAADRQLPPQPDGLRLPRASRSASSSSTRAIGLAFEQRRPMLPHAARLRRLGARRSPRRCCGARRARALAGARRRSPPAT